MGASASCRKNVALMLLLSSLLVGLPARSPAEGLECPEVGAGAVPDLLADSGQAKLVTSGNSVDVANEIYDLINRLQIAKPNISSTELTNVLIAAYCPAVAKVPGLSAAEKWHRLQQFDALLQRELAANMMPAGSLIIANVPLPPAVYRQLRSQAAVANQTPAQLMAAILAQAAGK
jgi:hypothetical protein